MIRHEQRQPEQNVRQLPGAAFRKRTTARRRSLERSRSWRSGQEPWARRTRNRPHVHRIPSDSATARSVQEVIDLSLVIAFLALALGEDHIVDRIRIEIGQRPYIVFGHAVNAQCGRRLVHNLVDQTIHLLLIVRRLLGAPDLKRSRSLRSAWFWTS